MAQDVPISKIRNALIVADIEGSSGCWDYRASSYLTPEWARACVAMTLDVSAVVDALFNHGVGHITVKDFHRTGYNLWGRFGLSWVRRQIKYPNNPVNPV